MKADYLPLWLGGAIRGRVRRDIALRVADLPDLEPADIGLQLRREGRSRDSRSEEHTSELQSQR